MAEIETLYRCRISFRWADTVEPRDEPEEKVFNRAFQFTLNDKAEVGMETHIGPACFPYVQLESDSHAAVARVAGKIERYINRRKDVVLQT